MKSNSTAKKPGYGHSQWCERTYHRKHWYSKPSDRFVISQNYLYFHLTWVLIPENVFGNDVNKFFTPFVVGCSFFWKILSSICYWLCSCVLLVVVVSSERYYRLFVIDCVRVFCWLLLFLLKICSFLLVVECGCIATLLLVKLFRLAVISKLLYL